MKRSWTRKTAVAAVTLAALATAGGALARPGGGGEGHMLEQLERGVGRAGLPAETAAAIYARIDQARGERRNLDTSLQAAHEQMRSLLEAEPANLEAVLAQADAVGALETEGRKIGLRTLIDIRTMLTPEQWQALAPRRGPGGARGDGRGADRTQEAPRS